MRLVNHFYKDFNQLNGYIEKKNIPNSDAVFIQIFYSNQDISNIQKIKDEINYILPNASIIGTSTAGVIAEGNFIDDTISISFSIFEASKTKSIGYKNKSIDDIINELDTKYINQDTKLLVIIANTFTFDATTLIKNIGKRFSNIAIAGGNSGDDFKFEKCNVFSTFEEDCDVVIGVIDSQVLKVETKYLLNWQTLGQKMKVTKSVGDKVFELNGKPIIDIYRYYLGDDVADNLLTLGYEFPLIYNDNGVDIARALVAFDINDGSITFAGYIPQDTYVKFGYANIQHIEKSNREDLLKEFKFKNEGLYIYSCAARRRMLGGFLNEELSSLDNIAPTTGFITYGELFHDTNSCDNNLLNITTTYVVLNENESKKDIVFRESDVHKDSKDRALRAITTLITRTSNELDENIYYLQQFKNAVHESSIFSIADEDGVIKEVNKNFELISGYTEDELVGHTHNIIRHQDTPEHVFSDMWKTITSGQIWKGLIKNRKKDGTPYHVISEIVPIYYKDGTFREYIGIRNDVTELEEYKHLLKHELDTTSKNLKENLNYTRQYEKAINSAVAVLKTDNKNYITYVNDKMCELSGYAENELVGMNCKELRHEKHRVTQECDRIASELKNGKIITRVMTNIAKNNDEYIINNLFYPIKNLDGEVIEHLQVIFDLTEVIKLNQEIIDTQKEVVFTMGAIGETRSKETGLHVKRVAEYSYLLAKLVGMSEEEAALLRQASPMHDIGKVAIPDSILNKPGKLTVEEFEIMKTHASIGYEMLNHSNRPILKASSIVANSHHEKWDGTGYPNGLSGENIHIYGRITAIADVFDALGHDRVYKQAWELNDILELFKEEKGRHFDPNLIDLFFTNLDMFIEIQKNLED